jgi:hypothetical protein
MIADGSNAFGTRGTLCRQRSAMNGQTTDSATIKNSVRQTSNCVVS